MLEFRCFRIISFLLLLEEEEEEEEFFFFDLLDLFLILLINLEFEFMIGLIDLMNILFLIVFLIIIVCFFLDLFFFLFV